MNYKNKEFNICGVVIYIYWEEIFLFKFGNCVELLVNFDIM